MSSNARPAEPVEWRVFVCDVPPREWADARSPTKPLQSYEAVQPESRPIRSPEHDRMRAWLGLRARAITALTGWCIAFAIAGCQHYAPVHRGESPPGARLERSGNEIVACGQAFNSRAPVVMWLGTGWDCR